MIEPKKHIKTLERKEPSSENRIGEVFRFDRNERTTPFPKEHLKKITGIMSADEMVAYPNLEPFYRKLVSWLKVDREEVLLTSGSDTGIKAVYEVFVEEGDDVVMLSPTYGMYHVYCRMFGATPKEIFYNENLFLPVERILNAINQNTKLIAIANPNHTGTVIPEEEITEVVKAGRDANALVLIDEAYYHFYEGTMLPRINEFDNLVITRTFSKAFGVAPLRIGYMVGNKEVISQLFKVKLTHELTSFGAKVGSYLLDNMEILNDYVRDVNEAKDVLYERLPGLNFEVLKSAANFVFFKPPSGIDEKKLLSELEKKRICLNGPFFKPPFSGHLRVTVGNREQMLMLCQEIENIVSLMAT